MQLNRSPAVYVIVKNNSKDEEKKKITLGSRMENGQIILNTESTLCYVSMLLFIISSLSGRNLCPNLVNIIVAGPPYKNETFTDGFMMFNPL